MRRKTIRTGFFISLATLAAAFLMPVAEAGTKRVCHQNIVSEKAWGETRAGARNRAVAGWIEAVRSSPGPEFADWDRSRNVSGLHIKPPDKYVCVNCRKRKNQASCTLDGRLREHGYVCSAFARPCKLVETGRDCRPRVNTLGDGAPNRRLAKDGARAKWRNLVTGLHGTGFSVWSKAKDSKLHCYNCNSSKAKNREICGSVRTGDRCLASARPCMVR